MRDFFLRVVQAAIVLGCVALELIVLKQGRAGAAFLVGIGVAIAVTVAPVALYDMIRGEIRKRRAIREQRANRSRRQAEPLPELYDDQDWLSEPSPRELQSRHRPSYESSARQEVLPPLRPKPGRPRLD